jgi:hypothetical protein
VEGVATPYAAPPATDDDTEPRSRWTTVGRIAVVVLAVSLTAMWIYAFFGDHGVPGRLDNPVFPAQAEPVCAAAHAQIALLPLPNETPTASARADVVDRASDQLDAMLEQLRGLVPANAAETEAETQWIEDWQIYVHDRRDYTAQLRVDPMTRFAVTQSERDKRQVTSALDRFAEINGMPSCVVPDDLA